MAADPERLAPAGHERTGLTPGARSYQEMEVRFFRDKDHMYLVSPAKFESKIRQRKRFTFACQNDSSQIWTSY